MTLTELTLIADTCIEIKKIYNGKIMCKLADCSILEGVSLRGATVSNNTIWEALTDLCKCISNKRIVFFANDKVKRREYDLPCITVV